MRRISISALLTAIALSGCSVGRGASGDDGVDNGAGPADRQDAAIAAPADARRAPEPPDSAYACGLYSGYKARTEGIVRSPCAYDVSKILSLGGEVKAKIRPPTISLEFPDGTFFAGTTDGSTFSAVRTQDFPFTDHCTWRATETLKGTIDAMNNCTLTSTYSYREMPISPPPCAIPCTIDAQVIIERTRIIIE